MPCDISYNLWSTLQTVYEFIIELFEKFFSIQLWL